MTYPVWIGPYLVVAARSARVALAQLCSLCHQTCEPYTVRAGGEATAFSRTARPRSWESIACVISIFEEIVVIGILIALPPILIAVGFLHELSQVCIFAASRFEIEHQVLDA